MHGRKDGTTDDTCFVIYDDRLRGMEVFKYKCPTFRLLTTCFYPLGSRSAPQKKEGGYAQRTPGYLSHAVRSDGLKGYSYK